MKEVQKRIDDLILLGTWLEEFCGNYPNGNTEFVSLIRAQHFYNSWFIETFVLKTLEQWAKRLSAGSFEGMLDKYPDLKDGRQQHSVAVIPEENMPLAGIHDLISIVLTGHHFYCRNVNHEHDLLKYVTQYLISIDAEIKDYIHWCENFPKYCNTYLVFAKSGHSATFKSYFENKHSLIRQKRISVGIIGPSDTKDDFTLFAKDIFAFFGISSYNVRKIYFPQGFALPSFIDALEEYAYLYQYNRYANNYDYHKSVFMMDRIPFYDNGFIILRESPEHQVPIGCLYYEFYETRAELLTKINESDNSIQNIVTTMPGFTNSVKPGCSHDFPLWDYTDHQDSIKFLLL